MIRIKYNYLTNATKIKSINNRKIYYKYKKYYKNEK